jgi:hypothetical protein
MRFLVALCGAALVGCASIPLAPTRSGEVQHSHDFYSADRMDFVARYQGIGCPNALHVTWGDPHEPDTWLAIDDCDGESIVIPHVFSHRFGRLVHLEYWARGTWVGRTYDNSEDDAERIGWDSIWVTPVFGQKVWW